ncbi:dynein regulatory complex subunit 2 [Triplophysa dalaica]|uniref:dynein regulatory complex subunit 2 n=1 Tax=Triplophysa dalaica TaxID=1582913 RepID=UPI0024DFA901|nr:dynein regulatory complex subunit 2 [Triplophysa dalaica]
MPKKAGRKGGGGKHAGMAEEERLLYLQQKAQAEEETTKRKEDMLTQFLKDKLEKEERNTVLNLYKLQQQWRVVLMQKKSVELRDDMSVLSQTFERVLDCKDSIIRSLVVDLSEREQQSELARSSHLHNMDSLLELHRCRLAELEMYFHTRLEELSSEYNTERDQVLSQHQQENMCLENMMFSMENQYANHVSEENRDYQSTRNQIIKQNDENKHAVQFDMEGIMAMLWREMQQTLHDHNKATEDKVIATEHLRINDEQSLKEINAHKKQILKLQDSITALRSQLSSSQTEETSDPLRSARDELAQKVQHFRVQLGESQAARRQQLTKLTLYSSKAAKKLQEIQAKGEKLLRLAEMCHKLETEHEKVLPFDSSSLSSEELSQERDKAAESQHKKLTQLIQDCTPLGIFWQRYNKVHLERLCLKREKLLLDRQNEQMRIYLKQYLDGIGVSDDSLLHHQHPLLTVSSPPLQAPAPTRRRDQKHYVVQEAANIAQQRL